MITLLTIRKDIADFFIALGVDLQSFIKTLKELIKFGPPEEKIPSGMPDQALPKKNAPFDISDCSENLNHKILKRGDFEISGREKEIERIFEILLKRNKSNAILVGEAGVGKTAIA